jgi:hypothetical protein
MPGAVQKVPLVTATAPPPTTRFWFWAFGRRVEPLYRPWVAEQLADPRFFRRRLGPVIGLQVLLIVIPQTLLAWSDHSRLRLLLPAGLLLFYGAYAGIVLARRKPLSPLAARRLLAYHGVTADGQVVPPVSAFDVSPRGRTGVVQLCAQLVVFATGAVIVTDHIVTVRSCHRLSAADSTALAAFIGEPVRTAAARFGDPAPLVRPGTPLLAAREVDTPLRGVHFVAGYVRDATGRLVGPAVWRLIDPVTQLNPSETPAVSAWNALGRQITPSTGYGSSTPEDPAVERARECAKAAR